MLDEEYEEGYDAGYDAATTELDEGDRQ